MIKKNLRRVVVGPQPDHLPIDDDRGPAVKEPKKRGPKPERLALPGPWESAVKKALKKTPPKKKAPEK
jgi:hypothetical protein